MRCQRGPRATKGGKAWPRELGHTDQKFKVVMSLCWRIHPLRPSVAHSFLSGIHRRGQPPYQHAACLTLCFCFAALAMILINVCSFFLHSWRQMFQDVSASALWVCCDVPHGFSFFFCLPVTLNREHKHTCVIECIMCDGAHRHTVKAHACSIFSLAHTMLI